MKFDLNLANQLLLNTRNPENESRVLRDLQKEFEKYYGVSGYFLIASSGSAKKQNESVKLIALSVKSVLNSATRFVNYFAAGVSDNWGLVLPEFHVAGLAVYARAYVAGSLVFKKEWSVTGLEDWITAKKIAYISMVPAQVFDIVQNKISAPVCIKKIFVGAGALNESIRKQALDLGWPIVETYGMTETASMIALRENNLFQVMPGVEVEELDGNLRVKCNSLLTASAQLRDEEIIITSPNEDWFNTEDKVEIIKRENFTLLKFLGRAGDYIKILGEGVSLNALQEKIQDIAMSLNIQSTQLALLAVGDERKENELVLAVEKPVAHEKVDVILNLFNEQCRPYEKINKIVFLNQIPRTALGKLKIEELKRMVEVQLNRGANG